MKKSPKISVFTCSYNKPKYVAEAIKSVLNQTFPDFEYFILKNSTDGVTRKIVHDIKDPRIKIFDEDISPQRRKKTYTESYLKNKYFPLAQGKYIMVLSDDDILMPNCFEEHMKEFNVNKKERANFHAVRVVHLNGKLPEGILTADMVFQENMVFRGGIDPNGKVDGGAVMFEKSLLEDLKHLALPVRSGAAYPPFRGIWRMAHISDGIFVRHLSMVTSIYPINKILHIKRCTQESTFNRFK